MSQTLASASGRTILTIDAGTSCVKAVVASMPGLSLLAVGTQPLDPPASAAAGRAEQRAEQWWESTISACSSLGESTSRVEAIALSGQMQSVLLVDSRGEPLLPAMLYSDSRASSEAKELEDTLGLDRLLSETRNWKGAVSVLPKLCWLHHHHPDLLERATYILLGAHDWLFFKLTGVATTDPTNASVTGLLRSSSDEWAAELLVAAGLPASVAAKLPVLATRGPALAPLLPAAAAQLGWHSVRAVTVCHGAGDLGTTTACALGTNSVGTYCYLGTSGWVATQRPAGTSYEGPAVCVRGASPGHSLLLAAPTTTAGGNLHWLASVLWPGVDKQKAFAALEAEAASAPAGCDGVLYLPYLNGERCPVRDPDARACFVGIGIGTSRGCMCRAVVEGLCFAVRSLLELLPPAESEAAGGSGGKGGAPPPLVLVGGVAASATLVQTLADVLQREVRVPAGPQHAPALGAARLALGAIMGEALVDAGGAAPAYARCATPDASLRPLFDRRYAAFCGLHPALRDTFPRLREATAP